MKTIEERVKQWAVLPLSDADRRNLMRMALIELAADLQAEHERSVNALNDTLSLNLGQLMEAQNRLAEKEKEVSELRGELAEAISALGIITYEEMPECECDKCQFIRARRQLLTRLGGSHE